MRRPVVVAGRYAGVTDVLADVLRTAGHDVVRVWAADGAVPAGTDPAASEELPSAQDTAGAVLVVLVSPADATLTALAGRGALADVARLVVVVWHPDDELPPLPPEAVVVRAGRILADLPRAVSPSPPR